jgi:hypothetical protein
VAEPAALWTCRKVPNMHPAIWSSMPASTPIE